MQEFITEELLKSRNVELDGRDVEALLAEVNEALEQRVGDEITDSLTHEQLQELVELQDKATDEEIGEWLTKNVPDFETIVQDQIEAILDGLTEEASEKA